jgi:hypothetical protein
LIKSPERNFETFHGYENTGSLTANTADDLNRKKNINEILVNFKKEKEQFNEKLS